MCHVESVPWNKWKTVQRGLFRRVESSIKMQLLHVRFVNFQAIQVKCLNAFDWSMLNGLDFSLQESQHPYMLHMMWILLCSAMVGYIELVKKALL